MSWILSHVDKDVYIDNGMFTLSCTGDSSLRDSRQMEELCECDENCASQSMNASESS